MVQALKTTVVSLFGVAVWLVGHQLSHPDRLGLMEAIDELPADLRAHVSQVGRRLV